MTSSMPRESVEMCPYWHQVTSDFMSVYPAAGYCMGGCRKPVKIMASATVERVCAMRYCECEGYQRLVAEEEARHAERPETFLR